MTPQRVILWILTVAFIIEKTKSETGSTSCINPNRAHITKRKHKKLDDFLADILKSREELTWIDRMADLMREKDLFYSSSILESKTNALFYDTVPNDSTIDRQQSPTHQESYKRNKRNPVRMKKLATRNDTSTNTNNDVERSRENFNPSTTTQDPLERLLGSINVFPVDKFNNSYDDDDDAAKNNRGLNSAAEDEIKIGYESSYVARRGRSLKSVRLSDDDAIDIALEKSNHDNNFTRLLLYDNPNDNSQIYRALHGDLAYDIVNAILSQMTNKKEIDSTNDYINKLQNNFVKIDDLQNQGFNSENDEHSVTKKLMNLAEKLIEDEIEKKSCGSLPPDLKEFLYWLLEIQNDNTSNKRFDVAGKSLAKNNFRNSNNNNNNENNNDNNNDSLTNLDEWYGRAETLKSLLNKCEELSRKDRNKVQAIREYLTSRLDFVDAYIDTYRIHLAHRDASIIIHSN